MRSKLSRLFLAALAVGAIGPGSTALAQADKVVREPDQIVVNPRTTIIFNPFELEGKATIPTVGYGLVVKAGPFKSWVQVRKNFLQEAQDSVSNL